MFHPNAKLQFISEEKGFGVVATELIPKGTITWVQDRLDREITNEECLSLLPDYQWVFDTYTFRKANGNFILCWDIARFVNHSFRANCILTPFFFEIAQRDILPGEEITDDYGFLNNWEPFECIDEGTARNVVYPDDLLKYAPIWDAQIIEALPQTLEVAQPLLSFLDENIWAEWQNIAKGVAEMPSIASLHCFLPFPSKIES